MSQHVELLETVEECDDATSFLCASNKLINLKLKALLPNIFVQDELVMEYAVEPLLKEDGPLVTTDVVSKLMFAMGKISLETYADIGLYAQVLEYAQSQPNKLSFGDDMIYDFISNQAVLSTQQDSFYLESINQLKFSSFEVFSQMRYESLIKTVLKLSCEMLLEKIEEEITQ
ncbi:MltR family transcriptional regulator [Aliivibrio fischeri]|uniref:Predicted DNA-binding transcriptional regulator n=1 Tax=Aliivibrio fischeri (strain ATCC 700601 / ES114) TaxID=312309 RepID=Q5E1G3_ALIF1|nr:MltR family transcriptional regulator [Aliivibrio fischeri]AAW87133.1 predicted DNA-binding transcriptional regulator [Aliivibrio fischeri ES114]KLU80775.1 transcriptional regulator [Aliivibrio fischeri]MCE7536011.1 transcriptional regulator [Aliivibrio fischeri]MCE7558673.1 transcriptional regulator [Aliivibrio fischeri]MUJ19977.1 transcriptional regulator [Aliivibrio fischeri]